MFVKLGELRIDSTSIARYESGDWVSGLDSPEGNYIYSDGTSVTLKDGKHITVRLPIAEVDSILLGRT